MEPFWWGAILLVAVPIMLPLLAFGPAEYVALVVLGLIASVALASGSTTKALAMIVLGTLIGGAVLVRDGVANVLDPGAEVALEAALQLAETEGDSTVTVLSMGPEDAVDAIRRHLDRQASQRAELVEQVGRIGIGRVSEPGFQRVHALFLLLGERLRQRAADLRHRNLSSRIIADHSFADEVAEETTERRKLSRGGARTRARPGARSKQRTPGGIRPNETTETSGTGSVEEGLYEGPGGFIGWRRPRTGRAGGRILHRLSGALEDLAGEMPHVAITRGSAVSTPVTSVQICISSVPRAAPISAAV